MKPRVVVECSVFFIFFCKIICQFPWGADWGRHWPPADGLIWRAHVSPFSRRRGCPGRKSRTSPFLCCKLCSFRGVWSPGRQRARFSLWTVAGWGPSGAAAPRERLQGRAGTPESLDPGAQTWARLTQSCGWGCRHHPLRHFSTCNSPKIRGFGHHLPHSSSASHRRRSLHQLSFCVPSIWLLKGPSQVLSISHSTAVWTTSHGGFLGT